MKMHRRVLLGEVLPSPRGQALLRRLAGCTVVITFRPVLLVTVGRTLVTRGGKFDIAH